MSKTAINAYVTANGGVVVLNGPFPLDEAHRLASLCNVAPDLHEHAVWVTRLYGTTNPKGLAELAEHVRALRDVLAKVQP